MLALSRNALEAIEPSVSPIDFDWDLRFEHKATQLGFDYWRSRCQGRPMPERSDLDPVAMRKFTQHVGLVDIRSGTDARPAYFVRHAGTRWEDVYGPIAGRYLHEFLPPELERSWHGSFEKVRTKKAPVRIKTRIDFQGKNWLSNECLVAPLGSSGEVAMLFVTFVTWGDVRFQPPPKSLLLHGA